MPDIKILEQATVTLVLPFLAVALARGCAGIADVAQTLEEETKESAAEGNKLWMRYGPGLWRWLSEVCKGDPSADVPVPAMKPVIRDTEQASAVVSRKLRRNESAASAGSTRSKRAKFEEGTFDLERELDFVLDEEINGDGAPAPEGKPGVSAAGPGGSGDGTTGSAASGMDRSEGPTAGEEASEEDTVGDGGEEQRVRTP